MGFVIDKTVSFGNFVDLVKVFLIRWGEDCADEGVFEIVDMFRIMLMTTRVSKGSELLQLIAIKKNFFCYWVFEGAITMWFEKSFYLSLRIESRLCVWSTAISSHFLYTCHSYDVVIPFFLEKSFLGFPTWYV